MFLGEKNRDLEREKGDLRGGGGGKCGSEKWRKKRVWGIEKGREEWKRLIVWTSRHSWFGVHESSPFCKAFFFFAFALMCRSLIIDYVEIVKCDLGFGIVIEIFI